MTIKTPASPGRGSIKGPAVPFPSTSPLLSLGKAQQNVEYQSGPVKTSIR